MAKMRLFNTLTRSLDTFAPSSDSVKLYTCGPTVYDYLHIGNWSAYIRWDILVRTLHTSGYKVNRVMNITDVGHLVSDEDEGEDKLQKGAQREGVSAWEIAQKYTNDFLRGMSELSLVAPTALPKATEHIEEQIALIKNLEDKGLTYQISDGIYFDTGKFPRYGEFARLDLESQGGASRIGVNPEKRHQSDFALWKFSPMGQKRDMEWPSPWGTGFPGWHIECSAIALKHLGETLDIHTGGVDHIPVHHTNEIAQSESATGKRFSNFWLHNNFMLIDGSKISKSLNNGYTLDDIKGRGFDLMDFKLFVLQSHYRTENNFSWELLSAARSRRLDLQALADMRWQIDAKHRTDNAAVLEEALSEFKLAMQDDLNTPLALSVLSKLVDSMVALRSVNKEVFYEFINTVDSMLGLKLLDSQDIEDSQKAEITERENARKDENWAKADEIRKRLQEQGIEINDTAFGPLWSRRSSI